MFLWEMEFDKSTGECYVLGFIRGKDGVRTYSFIGKFTGNHVSDIRKITDEEYDYIVAYKTWERSGYTQKVLEWNRIRHYPDKPHVSLKQVHDGAFELPKT